MRLRTVLAVIVSIGVLLGAAAHGKSPSKSPKAEPMDKSLPQTLEQLRTAALADRNAFNIVEELTTWVGPRLAGSPAERRAREWAAAMLRQQGFTNVRIEPFEVPYWGRKRESAHVLSPAPQRLVIATLAGSPSTPPGGLEAEVVRFTSIAALDAAAPATVAGRIVFIDEGMERTIDGSGYGRAVRRRAECPAHAQAKGAVACLIRTVGTSQARFAQVGGNSRQAAGTSLPAAALATPDADQLARLCARGAVRLALDIQTETLEQAPSGNVMGEIRGRERPDEVVVLGAHLDSWDLGTGAIDDGAGVAIVTAAAALIGKLPTPPRRTIRVVLFGAEEIGVHGGRAYAAAHSQALRQHVVAAESDFGAGRVYRLRTRFGAQAQPLVTALQQALAPLGVSAGDNNARGGADIYALSMAGVPVVELSQDGTRYFDYHHSADDTLDKIDAADLAQNVAAWALFAYLSADSELDLRTR